MILHRYLDGAGDRSRPTRARCSPSRRRGSHVAPVYFGAALTGVGVDELLHAIPRLLPPARTTAPVRRRARCSRSSGDRRARRSRSCGCSPGRCGREIASRSAATRRDGHRHRGLRAGHDAAALGGPCRRHRQGPRTRRGARRRHVRPDRSARPRRSAFAPPTLETAIVPCDADQKRAVFDALTELAEQDPLINLRQDDTRQELFLSLYGEVQKEIVAQTLQGDYGLDVEFRPTTPVCIERPKGTGAALELLPRRRSPARPFLATVGLAISPLPPGSGVTFELAVGHKVDPRPRLRRRRCVPRAHAANRPRHARPGPPRLGGHGLPRRHDRLRVPGPAAEVARDDAVGLPPPHTARADGRPAPGRHDRARAGARVPPRAPGARPRADHDGAERARSGAGQRRRTTARSPCWTG